MKADLPDSFSAGLLQFFHCSAILSEASLRNRESGRLRASSRLRRARELATYNCATPKTKALGLRRSTRPT